MRRGTQALLALATAAAFVMSAATLAGCRPDPGDPTYSELDDFEAPYGVVESLPGPVPYVPGVPRLSFGLFYEGLSSTQIAIDDQVVHYYIFEEALSGQITYTQTRVDDRVEGKGSDRLVHAGFAWWGGGIVFDAPRDLSAWTHLAISFRSTSEAFATIDVGLEDEDGPATVAATDYGWLADGEWHSLRIPLADFAAAGIDLAKLTSPLTLGGGSADAGQWLEVDDFYYTQE